MGQAARQLLTSTSTISERSKTRDWTRSNDRWTHSHVTCGTPFASSSSTPASRQSLWRRWHSASGPNGGTRSIAEADPPRVDRHGHVDVLVGVHADDHLPRVGLDSPVVRHRVASSGAGASAGWADRTVMGRRCRRPLLGHCPSGQTGCRVHRRRTMTDRSVARTVGQSSCGSGHHPPAPTSVTERPRQAAE